MYIDLVAIAMSLSLVKIWRIYTAIVKAITIIMGTYSLPNKLPASYY